MPQMGRLTPRSVGGMLLLALLWGLSVPVTKLGLDSIPPITFTALRFAVAVPVLVLFALGRHRIPRAALPQVAALGAIGIGVGNLGQSFGVAATPASAAAIIAATIPVLVVILAALRLGQPVARLHQAGMAAAFAGIALVALDRDTGAAPTTPEGVGFLLLSAVAISVYYVWSVELAARHGTVTVVTWSTLSGFLVLLPAAAWEAASTPFSVTAPALAAGLYLGLMVSVAGLFLWLWLLGTVPARVAASVQFLQPVVGIAASAAIFGDRMGGLFAAGAALVLAGIGLTVATRREPVRRPGPEATSSGSASPPG